MMTTIVTGFLLVCLGFVIGFGVGYNPQLAEIEKLKKNLYEATETLNMNGIKIGQRVRLEK